MSQPNVEVDMKEQWKKVVGFDGYEVSNQGRVRSLDRHVRTCNTPRTKWTTRKVKGQIIAQQKRKRGYMFVYIRRETKNYSCAVHRLVGQAFIDNPESKPCINHMDSNPSNNCVNNLEWCTHQENMRHAADAGRMRSVSGPGEKSPASKLVDSQVVEIKARIARGETLKSISRDYPVGASTIRWIKAGVTWSHITINEEAMGRG